MRVRHEWAPEFKRKRGETMTDEATAGLDLNSVDRVLKTTRSVRLRLDLERPVPDALIEEAIDVALQAPTGANAQTWRFVVVTDADLRAKIAEYYRLGSERYLAEDTGLARIGLGITKEYEATDIRQQRMGKVVKSAVHLIENLHRVPVHIIPCIEGRFEHEDLFTQSSMWGSILPAAWSLMLALRARGVASAWTTFTLMYEKEIGELLGIPPTYTQALLLPVAWLTDGDVRPAIRFPAKQMAYWNRWRSDG
jgi:nitroreductase